jgi:pimeloyl-ACP methyl ester carboxylesterase
MRLAVVGAYSARGSRLSKVVRNESSLYYETHGSGSPVLLTHGFAATSRMWRGQAEVLSDRHQVITWDMRGHGRSDSPDNQAAYSVEETVADMAALLDALDHERAIIGGHSLGGYMSLAFAMKYPERVRALLIIDTGPGYKSDPPREEWNQMARGLARRLDRDGLEHLTKLSSEMDPSDHDSAAGLAMAACGMLTQRDSGVIDSLSKIAVPTLVIVGEKDRAYLAASNYMARKIPDAKQVVIPNAGHAVNFHQPAHFNQTLEAFLERVG